VGEGRWLSTTATIAAGRKGIAAESIGEEEAPPKRKERERYRRERNDQHGRRRNGARRVATARMGPGATAAVRKRNGISTVSWRVVTPRPRSRAEIT
jgi:hypothetical protein